MLCLTVLEKVPFFKYFQFPHKIIRKGEAFHGLLYYISIKMRITVQQQCSINLASYSQCPLTNKSQSWTLQRLKWTLFTLQFSVTYTRRKLNNKGVIEDLSCLGLQYKYVTQLLPSRIAKNSTLSVPGFVALSNQLTNGFQIDRSTFLARRITMPKTPLPFPPPLANFSCENQDVWMAIDFPRVIFSFKHSHL